MASRKQAISSSDEQLEQSQIKWGQKLRAYFSIAIANNFTFPSLGLSVMVDYFSDVSSESEPVGSMRILSYFNCSDVVEVAGETLTGNRNVLRVVGDLVGVHHCGWYLDRAHEVEVVVAQVIRELFNLFLGQRGRVLDNIVVDRKGGGDCCPVSNHVEVKSSLCILVLNQSSVDYGTWRWVFVNIVPLLSESTVDSFVY